MIPKSSLRILRKAHNEVVAAPTAGQTRGEGQSTSVVTRVESATSQAEFNIYMLASDQVATFLVEVVVAFHYVPGPALAFIALIKYIADSEEVSSFFTEMGICTNIHRGGTTDLSYAVVEYIEHTGTELSINAETLAELARKSISRSMTSIACCMVLLVAAKQQVTAHAVTYGNRRLTAFLQSQKGLIPEADVIFGRSATFPAALVESVSNLARTSPAVCKMLLCVVQGLAESSRGDISKPAKVTLTLVSFAQATPLILATRFALSCPAVAKIDGFGLELRRLAAGIASMAQMGTQLK